MSSSVSCSPTFEISLKYGFCETHDVYVINNEKFIVILKEIEDTRGYLNVDFSNHNIILLAPLKSAGDLTVKGKSIVAMSSLNSTTGKVNITATSKLVTLGATITSALGGDRTSVEDTSFLPIHERHRDYIQKIFLDGHASESGGNFCEAINEIYAAILYAKTKKEPESFSLRDSFNYFGIPNESL